MQQYSTLTCLHCGNPFTCPTSQAPRRKCCSRRCGRLRHLGKRPTTLLGRFWQRVEKGDGCWVYTGLRGTWKARRASLMENRRNIGAHRLSWEIHFGPIPDGLFVCHRCDNPLCVRPEHLFLGTNDDNMADMKQKGRAQSGDAWKTAHLPVHPRGTRHGCSKLDDASVLAIRRAHAAGARGMDLALQFGVSASQISKIVRREGWKHL